MIAGRRSFGAGVRAFGRGAGPVKRLDTLQTLVYYVSSKQHLSTHSFLTPHPKQSNPARLLFKFKEETECSFATGAHA